MSKPLRWFGPKRIGVGVRPTHFMGFLVIVVSIAGFISGIHLLVNGSSPVVGSIALLCSILFFIIVSSLTYEKETSA